MYGDENVNLRVVVYILNARYVANRIGYILLIKLSMKTALKNYSPIIVTV